MSIEKLSEIPGVGSKTAEKLVESLGSEEEVSKRLLVLMLLLLPRYLVSVTPKL